MEIITANAAVACELMFLCALLLHPTKPQRLWIYLPGNAHCCYIVYDETYMWISNAILKRALSDGWYYGYFRFETTATARPGKWNSKPCSLVY
jgi:hypothetical protein